MKIWEILKRENIGKIYETTIYGSIRKVKVGYDKNSDSWLTVKRVKSTDGIEYPISQLYLGAILSLDFEEVKKGGTQDA